MPNNIGLGPNDFVNMDAGVVGADPNEDFNILDDLIAVNPQRLRPVEAPRRRRKVPIAPHIVNALDNMQRAQDFIARQPPLAPPAPQIVGRDFVGIDFGVMENNVQRWQEEAVGLARQAARLNNIPIQAPAPVLNIPDEPEEEVVLEAPIADVKINRPRGVKLVDRNKLHDDVALAIRKAGGRDEVPRLMWQVYDYLHETIYDDFSKEFNNGWDEGHRAAKENPDDN